MDCLANTGFDSWPLLIAALVVLGLGLYLALRARHTRSGRAALIALPLLLALGLATQSAPPATAASGAVPCASASAPTPASASATPSPSLTPSAIPSTSPTPPNDPTPTPTPTPTPAGCQQVNDKSDTLKNTDGDDKPDFIDLQSNRLDYDMYLVGNADLDILGAGFLSPGVDIDHDGIMDQVDTDTAHRGSPGAVHATW
ncbi:hypothetical protein [Mycetocola saprophilus]|uniref:hypothetical protein n=1 Tax=Mycetocola saprophilus TaxID=76636 RepID=UPI0004C1366D|nr:hypothetical protein [Mycetocola saprophilus]